MTELNSAKEQIIAASKANNEPQQLINRRLSARELMEKLRLPRLGGSLMTELNSAKEQIIAASKANNEPQQLINRRLSARELMEKLRLPRMQRFDFRTWPLIAERPLKWVESDADLVEKPVTDDEVIKVTQFGQTLLHVNLPQKLQDQGVILTDIFTAAREYPELFNKYFMTAINPEENLLTAYIADRGSRIKFIQHLTTVGDHENAANMMIELMAQENSEIDFSSLDEFGPHTHTYFKRRADIGKDAHVEWAVGLMNDGATVGDMDSELLGDGGYANSKMIAVTTRDQEVGVNNRVTNHGKHTTGLINQRGVILEKSELIFNGIGQIIHGAHGAKADQQNRVLIMSDQARGDANPILLIDENDVEAGHAASVGPVDQQQMYYLMSRGIPRAQAERMVIRGFLGAVLSAIPAADVRNKLITILERKLADGQQYK